MSRGKGSNFPYILAHHSKQRHTKFEFYRSSETVSRHFNVVLIAVLRLHRMLIVNPVPVPEDETDSRWSWFKGHWTGCTCLCTLLRHTDPRYRTRKGEIATNVSGVVSRDLQFIYVLSGWEGFATDSRILRNAVSRSDGLKVPHGQYYLVDAGYANGSGFLALYRGQRYHINIWRQEYISMTKEEYFNMKQSSARNCVEIVFGVLKMWSAILRSHSYYLMQTQCWIITACCLIHNFIKREMPDDPVELEYTRWEEDNIDNVDDNNDHIIAMENTTEWTAERDAFATSMFEHWMANCGGQVNHV